MRGALVIAGRDLRSAFEGPMAYVLVAAFLGVTGLLFWSQLAQFSAYSEQAHQYAAEHEDPAILERFSIDEAVVSPMLQFMTLLLLALVPLLTMRLLAEEKRAGTIELLLTAPVSPAALVAGKWLGGFATCLVALAATAWFPVTLWIVASPDVVPMLVGYLGLVLVAASFTAVGLLTSSLTESSLLAAFLCFVALLGSVFAGILGDVMPSNAGSVLGWFSIFRHFETFRSGVLDTGDLAFFACFTFGVLFLTHRVIESRRWR